ncbi:MAG: rhomboid family intramembrane serine protease [Bdellovibrionales bacterium]|nr:rhomboid family intramembrane serine protease [Bdellovibrionales bacterium]
MIIPYLKGIIGFRLAPVTWCLVFLNALVMVMTMQTNELAQQNLEKQFDDEFYVSTQGRLYAQFIKAHPEDYSGFMSKLADMAKQGSEEKVTLLGSLAIRNTKFMNEAASYSFKGDQIAIQYWREKLIGIKKVQQIHPSYALGLSSQNFSIKQMFSYIFVHSGLVHFAGNMLFLIIFGGMVEPVIGGLATLLVFLVSGVVAALGFTVMTGETAAPLVGASGAVSGMMALMCCIYRNYPVRFVYWLFLPFKTYSGFVFLPAWVILGMWLASDVAGWLGTLSEIGGVAYSAHLGGELAGVFVGLGIYMLRFNSRESLFPREEVRPRVGEIQSFHEYRPSA